MLRSIGFVTCLALFMVACGGGGAGGGGASGGDNPPPPPYLSSAPGDAALGQYLRVWGHDYTLNSSHSGKMYTIVYSAFPTRGTGHLTFNGNGPAYGERVTITLSKNGVRVSENSSKAYYLLDPVVPLGKTSDVGETPYGVVTSSFPLPATLTVGNSGDFENMTYYHDLTMSTVVADETSAYSVMAKDSTSLLLCLTSTISGVTALGLADGLANGTETDCYTVNASGTAELASIAMKVGDVTLKFK